MDALRVTIRECAKGYSVDALGMSIGLFDNQEAAQKFAAFVLAERVTSLAKRQPRKALEGEVCASCAGSGEMLLIDYPDETSRAELCFHCNGRGMI